VRIIPTNNENTSGDTVKPTRIRYESCTVNIGTGYLREMIFMIDFWRDRMGLVRFVGLL
jgi:hypothetical protein